MIKQIHATVSRVRDLSVSAREVTLRLAEPMPFSPGAFVNVFLERDGRRVRRAYSLASDDRETGEVSLAVRRLDGGELSPAFWEPDVVGRELDVMGPLGVNTVEKVVAPRVFLFAFGIGAGVVRSLALRLVHEPGVREIAIALGSRDETDEIYGDEFRALAAGNPHVTFRSVFTDRRDGSADARRGFLQANLDGYDFAGATVFACGRTVACDALVAAVKAAGGADARFVVEAFG